MKILTKLSLCCLLPLLLALPVLLKAEVKLNSLFSDHMVLQQGVDVPVWGTAAEGEKVTVTFANQKVSSVSLGGKWMLKLKPLKAGGPYTMAVTGQNQVLVTDILIGEVWLCSGQSNMERQLGPRPPQKPIKNWENERDSANYPLIREYYVPLKFSTQPVTDVNSRWQVCSPSTVQAFSAVGYFFAKNLFRNLKVPIGIIFSAYGGTEAKHWTPHADLEGNAELAKLLVKYDEAVAGFPQRMKLYTEKEPALMEKFRADSAEAATTNKSIPSRPWPPQDPLKRNPGGLYNAMIYPLLPFAIRGVCWYQGESDNDEADVYPLILSTMIKSWRRDFQSGDFPFLIVQVAPFKTTKPEIREAQLLVAKKVANTALVVTVDCGDSLDIHPTFKQPVGERLALAARALAYRQKIEYSGPLYTSMHVNGKKITLTFSHSGGGLVAEGGKPRGFMIAGSDKIFFPAVAVIKGSQVVVWSKSVTKPVSVRYGWDNVPQGNLFNRKGLPASPFRTGNE